MLIIFYALFIECFWWENNKNETGAYTFARSKPGQFYWWGMLKDRLQSITAHNEQYLNENIENKVFPVLPAGLWRTQNTYVLCDRHLTVR